MKIYVIIGANDYINKKGFKTAEKARDFIAQWATDHAKYFTKVEISKGFAEIFAEKRTIHFGKVKFKIVEIEVEK